MKELGASYAFAVQPTGLGLSGRNLLINGNFAINQRAYASGASLPPQSYAHDRWKNLAGSAVSYSFTQATPPTSAGAPSSPDTTITIPSGNSLFQIVEAMSVGGGSYTLSWTGTSASTVSYYTSSSATTTVASNVSSPATFTLPAGAYVQIGFGPGTVGKAQLEQGTQATPFERRHPAHELLMCQRYFQRWQQPPLRGGATGSTTAARLGMILPVPMRAAPTLSMNGNLPIIIPGVATSTLSSIATSYATATALEFDGTMAASIGSAGQALLVYQTGTASLDLSAEL